MSVYFVITQVLIGLLTSSLVTTEQQSEAGLLLKRKKPGLTSPYKAWWAKELTADLHTAGRLSVRDIKYASEAGFKSIISIYNYSENLNYGGEILPNYVTAEKVVVLSGISFTVLLGPDETWHSINAVEKMSGILQAVPRPTLVHCNTHYSATFITMMYLANTTKHDPTFAPRVSSKQFYRTAADMGLDYTSRDAAKKVVSDVTGESIIQNPPSPETIPTNWNKKFWKAYPVAKNWFTAGQILNTQIPLLEAAGFKTVVNMRLGVTTDGTPSQEPVTLLNIKDGSTSYGDRSVGNRQSIRSLQLNRIDIYKSPMYISGNATVNYESQNPGEFGDGVGYNEALQREAFRKSHVKYIHLPITLQSPYNKELFQKYKDELLAAGRRGLVLVHCRIGWRAGIMAVLAAAVQYDEDFSWAVKHARMLGYEVSPDQNADAFQMYSDILSVNCGSGLSFGSITVTIVICHFTFRTFQHFQYLLNFQ